MIISLFWVICRAPNISFHLVKHVVWLILGRLLQSGLQCVVGSLGTQFTVTSWPWKNNLRFFHIFFVFDIGLDALFITVVCYSLMDRFYKCNTLNLIKHYLLFVLRILCWQCERSGFLLVYSELFPEAGV